MGARPDTLPARAFNQLLSTCHRRVLLLLLASDRGLQVWGPRATVYRHLSHRQTQTLGTPPERGASQTKAHRNIAVAAAPKAPRTACSRPHVSTSRRASASAASTGVAISLLLVGMITRNV
jgi:hypothetical protein